MRSSSTCRSQNTLSNIHTGNVIWRCFFTNEHYFFTSFVPFNCFVSCENNLTTSSSRRSVESRSQRFSRFKSFCIKLWVEQLVKLIWFYTKKSFFFCNHSFSNHINCHLNSSRTCTFTVTTLKHEEFSFLYSEFHILHIVIVSFKTVTNCRNFFEDFWLLFFESRNIHWSTDTSYNVFTLSVDKIFSHKVIFTSRWVTRECNTSTRSFTHVTKYHCHNCNSSSFDNIFVNVVKFTIDDSAFVHPRTEYSTNSSPHLIFWILREVFTFFCFVHCFIFRNDSLKFFCCEFSIFFNSTNSFYFVNDSFEFIVVNTHSNVTEHLDKAAVSIPCKAWIVCFVCKSNNRLIIKTKVEDCIHHTRHRFSSTRTNRN